jgi:succinoglycan biosynthesis protein ExoV
MIASYLKWPGNNFGDKLNDTIFNSLGITESIDYKKPNLHGLTESTALGLGTLLTRKVVSPVTVLGSGANGISYPKIPLNYKFVRGKGTAAYLNLDPSLAVGDTAYFLKDYIQNLDAGYKDYEIGIIPHYINDKVLVGDNIISPTLSIEEFIIKASKCKLILAEAMHGAICADILRIPWAPISIDSDKYPIQHFKWNDFASVFDIDLDFGNIDSYNTYLSTDKKLNSVSGNVRNQLLAVVNK